MVNDRSPMTPVWDGLYPEALSIHEKLRIAGVYALIHNRPDCRLRLPADPSRTRVTVSVSPGTEDAALATLAGRAPCPLCVGTGRIGDDIPCWRCGESWSAISQSAPDVMTSQARVDAIIERLAPRVRRASDLLGGAKRG